MLLYTAALSLFGRKVEIALAEKGIAFDRVMVPFTQTEGYSPKHPAVLAANPKGQVPVLVDGDLTLYDSTVILEYLEDAYPDKALYPSEARARARCRLLELEADEVLLAAARLLFHRAEPPGPDTARREALEAKAIAAEAEIDRNHAELDMKLKHREFLCGGLSVADIATFLVIHYGLRNGGPKLSEYPRLVAWYNRLKARPAFAPVLAEIAVADRALSYPVAGALMP